MEIRIVYHPSSDTLINSINQLLKENGLTSSIEKAAENGEVRITVAKTKEQDADTKHLNSSFVHLDTMPGY